MKIPFALVSRSMREPASALLLPSRDAADLFVLLETLGLDALPPVFATADGFLCKLPQPVETPIAGVIRLRKLAGNLYLPVDADLEPALLPDEAEALAKSRGLIFLPGVRVLEFALDQPLGGAALLALPRVGVASWVSLPEPPALADELLEVASTVPPPAADAILEQGRDDIGSESPRPQGGAGFGKKIVGGASYAVGRSLAWLGTKLGLAGLAGAGAGLLQRAFDAIPWLSERLMGEQEATLRNLLKDFRDGKIEQALRRALPLDPPGSMPMTPAANARLPRHDLFYSLQNLLSGRRGLGGAWFAPGNIYLELQTEYRRQAEAAAQRGDYRRAAFIYAKLLNDLGAAAHILSQGGLHRDAAVIYEDVLHNTRAAAREWQAAGEIDKAVELYVQVGDDLAAAEVLQQIGETERALLHYRTAADKLIAKNRHFEAGELYRVRAQRLDLALAAFQDGWRTRPQATALPCGLFLAEHYAREADSPRFMQILSEGETCAAALSAESCVQFFNQLARLTKQPALLGVADDTRDRCLSALSRKMTQPGFSIRGVRAGSLFFPADTPWAAPVVRDGQFALQATERIHSASVEPTCIARVGASTVRALCHMPQSGDLFLGFENGEIVQLRLASGNLATLTKERGPILGLLADAEERHLIALTQLRDDMANVSVASRSVHFRFERHLQTRAAGPARLCAAVDNQPSPFFGVLTGQRCVIHRRDNPSWTCTLPAFPESGPYAGIVGSLPKNPFAWWCLLFFADKGVFVRGEAASQVVLTFGVEAMPENPDRSTLYQPPLQGWLEDRDRLAIQWVTRNSSLYAVELILDPHVEQSPRPQRLQTRNPVLGVHGSIDRRLTAKSRMTIWDSLADPWFARGQLVNPVAAICLESGAVLIVEASGALTRVPINSR